MPQEPKKRHSRQRQGKRRASISLSLSATLACDNCGKAKKPHMICPHCGYYKGVEMMPKSKKVASIASETPTS